ncbi:hypothetical protein BDV34DRAFT_98949 [Aspergillus parasiticus]|uniref:Uncharacterized protein n=1 Tax=Aspergillus parasiticus TaxID=5067 RepID=A0A5N6DKM6_ASPPA|nr:hypothetical protein BDV34DRAFT_98949 [Aspergillus parasiticus]
MTSRYPLVSVSSLVVTLNTAAYSFNIKLIYCRPRSLILCIAINITCDCHRHTYSGICDNLKIRSYISAGSLVRYYV